jgi:hypothetical protein
MAEQPPPDATPFPSGSAPAPDEQKRKKKGKVRSSMYYKGQRKPLSDVARELGVDLIVERSVTRAGDRVRISAQLIDAKRDEQRARSG